MSRGPEGLPDRRSGAPGSRPNRTTKQAKATDLSLPSQLYEQPEQVEIQVQKFGRHSESEVISRSARSEAPLTQVGVSALRSSTVERGKTQRQKPCWEKNVACGVACGTSTLQRRGRTCGRELKLEWFTGGAGQQACEKGAGCES